jgi:predicted choloylglycine hydrolase
VDFAVVEVAGDSYARGRAFGTARCQQIECFISAWLNSLQTAGVEDPHRYIATLLRESDFLSAIREYTPDLFEEVTGIALGADQPIDLVLASQLMDEEWAYRRTALRRGEAMQKCSSIAIASNDGPTWIGQNMDLGGHTDGHQMLLRIAPPGAEPGALVFTVGGMIGLMGVNTRGVAVCVNALPQLPASRSGLPVAFMIRKLLQAESVPQAVDFVRTAPHATGQHYLIADATAICSFEASVAGVVEYGSPVPARVLHTNHPLLARAAETSAWMDYTDSVARLKSLSDRLMVGEPKLDAIKAALSSFDDPEHPVCRVLNRRQTHGAPGTMNFTTGSMISEVWKDSPVIDIYVSAGPPSVSGFTHIELARG